MLPTIVNERVKRGVEFTAGVESGRTEMSGKTAHTAAGLAPKTRIASPEPKGETTGLAMRITGNPARHEDLVRAHAVLGGTGSYRVPGRARQ